MLAVSMKTLYCKSFHPFFFPSPANLLHRYVSTTSTGSLLPACPLRSTRVNGIRILPVIALTVDGEKTIVDVSSRNKFKFKRKQESNSQNLIHQKINDIDSSLENQFNSLNQGGPSSSLSNNSFSRYSRISLFNRNRSIWSNHRSFHSPRSSLTSHLLVSPTVLPSSSLHGIANDELTIGSFLATTFSSPGNPSPPPSRSGASNVIRSPRESKSVLEFLASLIVPFLMPFRKYLGHQSYGYATNIYYRAYLHYTNSPQTAQLLSLPIHPHTQESPLLPLQIWIVHNNLVNRTDTPPSEPPLSSVIAPLLECWYSALDQRIHQQGGYLLNTKLMKYQKHMLGMFHALSLALEYENNSNNIDEQDKNGKDEKDQAAPSVSRDSLVESVLYKNLYAYDPISAHSAEIRTLRVYLLKNVEMLRIIPYRRLVKGEFSFLPYPSHLVEAKNIQIFDYTLKKNSIEDFTLLFSANVERK